MRDWALHRSGDSPHPEFLLASKPCQQAACVDCKALRRMREGYLACLLDAFSRRLCARHSSLKLLQFFGLGTPWPFFGVVRIFLVLPCLDLPYHVIVGRQCRTKNVRTSSMVSLVFCRQEYCSLLNTEAPNVPQPPAHQRFFFFLSWNIALTASMKNINHIVR